APHGSGPDATAPKVLNREGPCNWGGFRFRAVRSYCARIIEATVAVPHGVSPWESPCRGDQALGISVSDATAFAVATKSRATGESTSVRHAIANTVGGMSGTGMKRHARAPVVPLRRCLREGDAALGQDRLETLVDSGHFGPEPHGFTLA